RRYLHSFPTRRSSDLILQHRGPQEWQSLNKTFGEQPTNWTPKASGPPWPPCARNSEAVASQPFPMQWLNGKTARPPPCPHQTPCRLQSTSILPSLDRKSTRLNSSHVKISYAVFCLKKKMSVGSAVRLLK